MASLIDQLRRRGHVVRLDGLRVVVLLAPGADVATAERWTRQRENQLRAELVAEQHAACGMAREVFVGGRVREVRDEHGQSVRGQVEVRARSEVCQ